MPDIGVKHSKSPLPLYIPTEVCENIIDMLYSEITEDTLVNITALHSCALVCQAWRVRSQRMLFYLVQLSDTISLRRLSTILDNGPHLRDYVRHVELTGYHLHNTTSIFGLFPLVFAGRLPNLERIDIVHLFEAQETRFSRTSDPPKAKSLPYIPLHPRFPAFLSSFTAVSELVLNDTTFRSFTEFARTLHGLPNLEELTCISVSWIAPGGAHPGADFTKQPDWMPPGGNRGLQNFPPFAPKLRELWLMNIPSYGAERLILTRGPHLSWLEMTIPLSNVPEEPIRGSGTDLSSCTGLRTLFLALTPQFSMDKHAGFVKDLLASWKPRCPEPLLKFAALREDGFTRQCFADVLHGLGIIAEAWLQTIGEKPHPAGEAAAENANRGVKYRLDVEIYDWEAERKWWSDRLESYFPTWSRLGRLSWRLYTRTYDQWADEEKSPLSDSEIIPTPYIEELEVDLDSPSKGDLSTLPR